MKKIIDAVKKFVGRENDKKYHAQGLEFPDPKPIEVPLKLLQRHQDAQAYIRAYVQSEIALARMNGEHETMDDAFDFEVEGSEMDDVKTARELEAEELAQMANDSYDLRRVRALVDRDRRYKKMRSKGGAPAGAPGADHAPSPQNPPPVNTPTTNKAETLP